ncbi:MAG: signal peptidase II [Candidatus Omnitrophota bacterium]
MPWLILFAVLSLDQLSKFIVLERLSYLKSIPVILNVFHLTLVKNYGIAFGLFPGFGPVFIAVAIIFVLLVFRQLWSHKEMLRGREVLGLYLVLGGALGNLVDRLRFGYVVDFLDFRVWPVFNVADTCISVGAGLIVWQLIGSYATK